LPGFSVGGDPFFHEFVLRCPLPAAEVVRRLLPKGIVAGFPLGGWYPELADSLLVCVTELQTREDIDRLAAALKDIA
jgi:glycine dehydrogenase subunit 1